MGPTADLDFEIASDRSEDFFPFSPDFRISDVTPQRLRKGEGAWDMLFAMNRRKILYIDYIYLFILFKELIDKKIDGHFISADTVGLARQVLSW